MRIKGYKKIYTILLISLVSLLLSGIGIYKMSERAQAAEKSGNESVEKSDPKAAGGATAKAADVTPAKTAEVVYPPAFKKCMMACVDANPTVKEKREMVLQHHKKYQNERQPKGAKEIESETVLFECMYRSGKKRVRHCCEVGTDNCINIGRLETLKLKSSEN